MSRPADGLCAKCRRPLPPEHYREWLSQGTDVCMKCAIGNTEKAQRTRAGLAYRERWKLGLYSHLNVMARPKTGDAGRERWRLGLDSYLKVMARVK
jgi:hypothetical protein